MDIATSGHVEPRETSAAILGLLVHYVEQHGGPEAVADVLERADVPYDAAKLSDLSTWVSHATAMRLFHAAQEVLDDPRVPFKVGAESLQTGLNHSLVLVVRALGSPRQVYRKLPPAVGRFTTTSAMEILETGATHAVIRYQLSDGYTPDRAHCTITEGLISVVPEIFGLPRARITHARCQVDGDPACLFRVRWQPRSLRPWRRRSRAAAHRTELVALRGQLEALQSAASELVDSDSLDEVIDRVTGLAAASVLAPAYLLAVRSPDGGAPLVRSAGVAPEQADELARELLETGSAPNGMAVEVESSRRVHGYLAALYGDQHPANDVEVSLLHAYAHHAAVALDMLIALEDSRRDERRANALLRLAHRLAYATEPTTVAETVTAELGDIVDSDASTVMLWDAENAMLHTVAVGGMEGERAETLRGTSLRADDVPELAGLLTDREPLAMTEDAVSPIVAQLLAALELPSVIVVPMLAGDEFLGLLGVGWRDQDRAAAMDDVLDRLRGVGDQASTALRNARLMATVRRQAEHDALTGLPNRERFTQLLAAALDTTGPDEGVTVLFCDLDRFKQVNDSYGHAVGDELLRQVAVRLRRAVRPADVVGRLSGDEFAVILSGVADAALASDLARRILNDLAEPYYLEGRNLRITTSVGVAVHRGEDGDGDLLLRAADDAMYRAKALGRNQIATDGADRTPSDSAHPSLERELATAVGTDQLRLYLQPVVEVRDEDERSGEDGGGGGRGSARIVGAEALVRWQHPRLGLLGPDAFLPLAEESGRIADIDLWMLEAACASFANWGEEDQHVAVNLSVATVLDPRLPATLRRVLARHAVAPRQLSLEVEETRALIDLPGVVERLGELRELDISLAIDNVGTGHATLTWLHRVPVDRVKVDRSLVSSLPGDAQGRAVIGGVLAMARELGVKVVAEGVEHAAQATALHELGCRLAQGYLFGRPEPGPPTLARQTISEQQ